LSPRGCSALLLGACTLVACGGGSPSPARCTSTCPQAVPEALYATTLNQVVAFAVDPTTGALTQSATAAGPNDPGGVAAAPSGDFLYVSDFGNTGSNAVDAFAIAPTTNALAAVNGSPFAAGSALGGGGVAIDPAGKFLYVTQENQDSVVAFSVDGTTGVLTPVTGSPFPASTGPGEAAVDPSGKFLYVSDYDDAQGAVSAYTIDAGGALTPVAGSPFPTQASGGPAALVVHPGGKFLYVGLAGTANANHVIAAFSIDGASGGLTPLAGSPFPAGMDPLYLALDPAGRFLYAADVQDDTISAFAVDASSGVPTKVAGSPFIAPSPLADIVVDLGGAFLFAASGSEITTFGIDSATGALSNLASLQIAGGGQLLAVARAK
jgi:6-phosphogluconolactonase